MKKRAASKSASFGLEKTKKWGKKNTSIQALHKSQGMFQTGRWGWIGQENVKLHWCI